MSKSPARRNSGNGNGAVQPVSGQHPNGNGTYPQAIQMIPLPYYGSKTTENADEFTLKPFLQLLKRRAWLVGGVAVAVTLMGWANAIFGQRPYYSGYFEMLIEDSSLANEARDIAPSAGISSLTARDFATQLEVLRSSSLLEPITERLKQEYPGVSISLGGLQVLPVEGTKVVEVRYNNADPVVVQAVLREVADAYLTYSLQKRQNNLRQGLEFVETQLPELRERVNSLQKTLEQFRQRYSLINPESRGGSVTGSLASVEQSIQESQIELAEASSLANLLQRQIGYNPDQALVAASLSESPRYQGVLDQIQQLEVEIALESARFQPGSPNIQALLERRQNLIPLLDLEARRLLGDSQSGAGVNTHLTSIPLELVNQLVQAANQVQVLQIRIRALQAAQNQLKQEFGVIPSLARQYTDIQRELQIATESLNRFLATRENLEIEFSQQDVPWELIADPIVAGPITPDLARNLLMATLIGVAAGVATGYVRDRLDHVFHTSEELKEAIKFPLLGLIPYHKALDGADLFSADLLSVESAEAEVSQPTRSAGLPSAGGSAQARGIPRFSSTASSSRVSYGAYASSALLEAFRMLYGNLRFLNSDTPVRSLAVGSAVPADGKSTVSIFLGRVAASMGQRVLLVDADMRRPRLHQRLGLPNLRGLSNVLASDLEPAQAIQAADNNLSVLTAGQVPPDPTRLLSSQRMKNLVDEFSENFDMVIYDTPPLLGLADGSLLGAYIDGILLVVGLGKTDRSAVIATVENLDVSCVPILGVVANGLKAETDNVDYYYRYYQNYYHQSSPDESETVNIS